MNFLQQQIIKIWVVNYHIATLNEVYVNNDLDVYDATTQVPVIYKSIIPINPTEWFDYRLGTSNSDTHTQYGYTWDGGYFNNLILKDASNWQEIINREIVSGDTYTCPWGHSTTFNSLEFMTIFKYVLGGFYLNTIEQISANPNLKTVDAYTSWLVGIIEDIDVSNINVDVYIWYINIINNSN